MSRKLLMQQLSVWQDIVALESGRDWCGQIEGAIRSKALEQFVLVVTPASLKSAVREILLARQEGKKVSPINELWLLELNKLPRWIGQLSDLDLPESLTSFFACL